MWHAFLSVVGHVVRTYVLVTFHCLAAVLATATVLLRLLRGLLWTTDEAPALSKQDEMWLLESTTLNPMYVAAVQPRSTPAFCQPQLVWANPSWAL